MIQMKITTEVKLRRTAYWFVLINFALPVCFLIYRITALETVTSGDVAYRSRTDYLLMLIQCLLGAIVMHLPYVLQKNLKMEIPFPLYLMYIGFLYCAIFLGEVRSFYYRIPYWDKWLHNISAVMSGSLGFIVVDIIKKNRCGNSFSPVFSAIFAFCFSVSVGVLWEIYEYIIDSILELNMQKYLLEDRTPLIGRMALMDTMIDIIIDVCGSMVSAVIGYISIKRRQTTALTHQNVMTK